MARRTRLPQAYASCGTYKAARAPSTSYWPRGAAGRRRTHHVGAQAAAGEQRHLAVAALAHHIRHPVAARGLARAHLRRETGTSSTSIILLDYLARGTGSTMNSRCTSCTSYRYPGRGRMHWAPARNSCTLDSAVLQALAPGHSVPRGRPWAQGGRTSQKRALMGTARWPSTRARPCSKSAM